MVVVVRQYITKPKQDKYNENYDVELPICLVKSNEAF